MNRSRFVARIFVGAGDGKRRGAALDVQLCGSGCGNHRIALKPIADQGGRRPSSPGEVELYKVGSGGVSGRIHRKAANATGDGEFQSACGIDQVADDGAAGWRGRAPGKNVWL